MRATTLLGAIAAIASGCSDETFEHTFISASAVSVGDSLRFAVTGFDINSHLIETTTLRPGDDPTPLTAVTVDGAPLREASAQLAAIGDHVYLTWFVAGDDGGYRGAPLGDDGAIDAGTIVDLGTDEIASWSICVTSRRCGTCAR